MLILTKHVITYKLYAVGIMSMLENDCELDEILIGVDLDSSPDQELDLLPDLVWRGWHPWRRPEGKCKQRGSACHETPLDINILHVLCTTIVQRSKKCVKNLELGFSHKNFLTRNIITKYF